MNEFKIKNGLIIEDVPTGSSSNQVLVINTSTNKVESKNFTSTSGINVSGTTINNTPINVSNVTGITFSELILTNNGGGNVTVTSNIEKQIAYALIFG